MMMKIRRGKRTVEDLQAVVPAGKRATEAWTKGDEFIECELPEAEASVLREQGFEVQRALGRETTKSHAF